MRLLAAIGGEEGCRRLAESFYRRVGADPILKPLFPGNSMRCATEEFGAFLIQFLGGDESQTQKRWWLSLRESHARFRIDATQRRAWLKNMEAALGAMRMDDAARREFWELFVFGASYLGDEAPATQGGGEIQTRWQEQQVLDSVVAAIVEGDDAEAMRLAVAFSSRPAVFVGILVRMLQTGRETLVGFVLESVRQQPSLVGAWFAGRSLLHFAAGAGCVEVVSLLLRLGMSPGLLDRGGHTPLYRVANECGTEAGPLVVRLLVEAGADVNACDGVTRATPLHMAARRGFVGVARALLDCGANIAARDRKGDTPLMRALNCRQRLVADLLSGSPYGS